MVYSGYSVTIILVSAILPILASLAVAARFKARSINFLPFKADDYLILVALVISTGECIFCIWGAIDGGIGAAFSQLDRDLFVKLVKSLLAIGVVHGTSLAVIKISILAFYKRIFCTPRFCLIANVTIGVVISWWMAFFIGNFLVTTPLSAFWTEAHPKTNYNYGSFMVAYAALDVAVDVFILCLPIPVIGTLHMGWKRKLQVVGIIWLGLFCVISGGIRMRYVISNNADDHTRPTFSSDITNSFIWSIVEPCTSIIAACLPTFGPLLQRWRKPQSMATSAGPIVSALGAGTATTSKSGHTSNNSSSLAERGWLELGEGGTNNAGVVSRYTEIEMERLDQETRQSHRAIYVERTFSVDGA